MDQLIDWLPRTCRPARATTARSRSCTATTGSTTWCSHKDRAAHRRGARLGAVDAGPSAGRLQLPLHGLAHPARHLPRHRRARPRGARHPRAKPTTCAATASAPAAPTPHALMADWNFYLAYNLFRLAVDHAGHRQARGRRHRRQRTGPGHRRLDTTAGGDGLEVRPGRALTPSFLKETPWTSATRPRPRTCATACGAFMDEHVYPAEGRYAAEIAGQHRRRQTLDAAAG